MGAVIRTRGPWFASAGEARTRVNVKVTPVTVKAILNFVVILYLRIEESCPESKTHLGGFDTPNLGS
jgi:hypothetical protein